MVTCPDCSHPNAPGSDLCAGCGKLLNNTGSSVTSAPRTVVDRVAAARANTPPPSLPAPMVEPIAPASTTPRPRPPEGSALTRAVLEAGEEHPDSGSVPAASTVREPPREVPPAPPTVAAPSGPVAPPTPPAAQPRLVVVRGERMNAVYPVLEGRNYIGRSADKPVDIDLDGQEPIERIWTSRQHAVIVLDRGRLTVEDLNSLNGTFVNRTRIHAGQPQMLHPGDVVQIGTVQLRVAV